MTPIYIHPCGNTLAQMVDKIRNAIYMSTCDRYYAGVRPDDLPHFWYVHQGWFQKTLHPAVYAAMLDGPPKDLHTLVLETPHLSTDGRLAYVQSDQKGRRNLQTVTTPGKYLTRHFPQFKSDRIRSLAECKIGCRLIYTLPEMLEAMYNGPHSCMAWRRDGGTHPYNAYDPKYGWGMAINEEGTNIIGRALVHFPTKTFVRTYRKTESGSTSSCTLMQSWLKDRDFRHVQSWPNGIQICQIDEAAPYLDGDIQTATSAMFRGESVWVLSEDGDALLTNIDGSVSYKDDYNDDEDEDNDDYIGDCEDCSSSCYEEDDHVNTGWAEDRLVCSSCANNYESVIGRRSAEYLVLRSEAIVIAGVWYDDEFLSDQDNLCCTADDDYEKRDDCFFCDVDHEYYLFSSETAIELDNGDTAAACNARQCEISQKWFSKDHTQDLMNLADGRTVHYDYAWRDDETDLWYGIDDIHRRVELENGNMVYRLNQREETNELSEEHA